MNCESQKLLNEINILDFAVREINLFLDTHPCHQEAMRFFTYYNRLKKEKTKEFASLYGPLTLDEAKQTGSEFLWTVQPWPWEGGME